MIKIKVILGKKRKGFTLIEAVACMMVLAIVSLGMFAVSNQINQMRIRARNEIWLSMHNLNCMERLRQMSYELQPGEELLDFYGSVGNQAGLDPSHGPIVQDIFSTTEAETSVWINMAKLEKFRVYHVRIHSRMIGYTQTLTNTYVFTNMGGPRYVNIGEEEGTIIPPDNPIGS